MKGKEKDKQVVISRNNSVNLFKCESSEAFKD